MVIRPDGALQSLLPNSVHFLNVGCNVIQSFDVVRRCHGRSERVRWRRGRHRRAIATVEGETADRRLSLERRVLDMLERCPDPLLARVSLVHDVQSDQSNLRLRAYSSIDVLHPSFANMEFAGSGIAPLISIQADLIVIVPSSAFVSPSFGSSSEAGKLPMSQVLDQVECVLVERR